MLECEICHKALRGKQTRFCSQECKGKWGNAHYQRYDSQSARGITRKWQLINSMGGKCARCGYRRNAAALHFHHRDGERKEFKLDLRKLANSSIEKLRAEAAKCEILCNNCHTEEHHPRFNG